MVIGLRVCKYSVNSKLGLVNIYISWFRRLFISRAHGTSWRTSLHRYISINTIDILDPFYYAKRLTYQYVIL